MVAYVRRAGSTAVAAALALSLPLVVPQSTAASGSAGPNLTCVSPDPCLEWDNSARGSGLIGTSAKGTGVVGQTKAGGTTSHTGVNGRDISTTNFRNSGVLGTSSLGNGVEGRAGIPVSHPFGDGVLGASTLQNGVQGQILGNHTGPVAGVYGQDLTADSAGAGVRGESTDGNGVRGLSTNANGVQGVSSNLNASGVYGENEVNGGFGVAGRSVADGFGVMADNPVNGAIYPALYVHQGPAGSCLCPEILVNNNSADAMTLDTAGNMVILGTLTQNGSLRVTTATNGGRKVVAYAPRDAQPAIEDSGEAQLVEGQAVVRLDPTFASSIDARSPYLVFVTPDGSTSGGLYVSSKTVTGFTVRENGAGRSSVVFDYRIVAKPYGASAPRLPLYEPPHYPKLHLPTAWHRN